MRKVSSLISLLFISSSFSFFLTNCNKTKPNHVQKVGVTVDTVESFKQAIAEGAKTILVSDLDFNHDIVVINRDVDMKII